MRLLLSVMAVLASLAVGAAPEESTDRVESGSSCIVCHAELDDELGAPVSNWERDVHAEVGLGCEDCHGGDASPNLADDAETAMSHAAGFAPSPDRLKIPGFCGDCHARPDFMRQFNPQARVDQLTEYRTSAHGLRNAAGDPVPATCIDCHGVHGIRRVDASDSPVYATNVPETCAVCHASDELMRPYGLPTDQLTKYLRSVHGAALLERQDIAAPACNDCHGNHGATPPGVQSVANVCGQCHGREAQLFRASFKKELLDAMEVAECTVCHSNHLIFHPTPEMFRSGSAPRVSVGEVVALDPFSAALGDLQPGQQGEVVWIVTLDSNLNPDDERFAHRVVVSAEGVEPLELDATVVPGAPLAAEELREAISVAARATLRVVPRSGLPVKPGDNVEYRLTVESATDEPLRSVAVRDEPGAGAKVVQGSVCLTCHTLGDECDQATERMYAALSAADLELRAAERVLHEAEVAGMDVGEVQFELNSSGTTALMDARALIHTFDPDAMITRTDEARGVAQVALDAGLAALAELQFRRRGLAVSLVLIILVLVGLFFKIREVDRRRRPPRPAGR